MTICKIASEVPKEIHIDDIDFRVHATFKIHHSEYDMDCVLLQIKGADLAVNYYMFVRVDSIASFYNSFDYKHSLMLPKFYSKYECIVDKMEQGFTITYNDLKIINGPTKSK